LVSLPLLLKTAFIWQGGYSMKQYIVELTSEERYQLQQVITKGNTTGYGIKYAHILLKADQGKEGPGWSDSKITEAFEYNVSTVYRLRKRLVEDGFDAILQHGNTGKRYVRVRLRRTQLDFAEVIRELCDELHPDAEKIVLVMDNLNTHTIASLYEAFEPAKARCLAEKLENSLYT
jgi:hypothetical protein